MAELLKKKKSTALSSFTRSYNTLEKLLSTDCPVSATKKVIEELEQKYKALEEICEAIQLTNDDLDTEIENMLTINYEKLNEIRTKAYAHIDVDAVIDISSHSKHETSSSASAYSEIQNGVAFNNKLYGNIYIYILY